MFLELFDKIILVHATGETGITYKSTDGTEQTMNIDHAYRAINFHSTTSESYYPVLTDVHENYNYGGVVFGDGDKDEVYNDYALSGNVITGITCSANKTVSVSDNVVTITVEYTITNNNQEAITINEYGVKSAPHSSYYKASYVGLIIRNKLAFPLVIEAGGVGQYTCELKFAIQ